MATTANSDERQEIVVLDDEDDWLIFFKDLNETRRSRFKYKTFQRPQDAMDYISEHAQTGSIYAAFIDVDLRTDLNGVDFIRQAQDDGIEVPFILCTQYASQDFEKTGIAVKELIEVDVSDYVVKDDLRFAEDQNVDQVAVAAYDRHVRTLRRMFRSYAEGNFRLLAACRSEIASTVATLDRMVLTADTSDPLPIENQSVKVECREILATRRILHGLIGRMQTGHVAIAQSALRNDTPKIKAEPVLAAPRFREIDKIRAQLVAAATKGGSGAGVLKVRAAQSLEDRSRGLHKLQPYDQAVALSLSVESLQQAGQNDEALDLAIGAAEHFAARRDVLHEVAFVVIAGRLHGLRGDRPGRALLMRRARNLARRSGSISLQLDLLGNV